LVKLESDVLEKPLKSGDANAFMEAALGMSFKGFYETCWTPQGTLVDILTCSHAVRVAFFQRLAGTREAETIRGIIQENGINKLPTFIDRTTEISEIDGELQALETSLVDLRSRNETFDKLFQEYQGQLTSVQGILAMPTQAQHDQSVNMARTALDSANKALAAANAESNLTPVPEAQPPSPEMEQAKANSENCTRIQNSMTALEKAGNALEEQMPDVAVEDPEPIRVELEKDNNELIELKPRYDLATNKTCPTCNRPYEFEGGEQARDAVIKDYQAKQQAYTLKHSGYMTCKREFDTYQSTTRSLQARIDANTAQWQSAQAELEAIPKTTFDAEAYQQAVSAYQAYMSYLQAKQAQEGKIRQLEQGVDKATTALENAMQAPFTDDEARNNANEFMTNYNEILEQRRQISANLSGAESRKTSLTQQKAGLEKEQAKRQGVSHVRNLFERAREKLHRDVLPKLVMQKMLFGLNSLLDQYLSVFDTNFTAYINEEFDFICSFATKSDVPSRALSGGQKVALALAFKFAVSDLTATSVPFLVLDEPTVWLDEINKPRLAEVLTKAKEVTEKGVFVLVATHEPLLFPAFSRTFDVSERQ